MHFFLYTMMHPLPLSSHPVFPKLLNKVLKQCAGRRNFQVRCLIIYQFLLVDKEINEQHSCKGSMPWSSSNSSVQPVPSTLSSGHIMSSCSNTAHCRIQGLHICYHSEHTIFLSHLTSISWFLLTLPTSTQLSLLQESIANPQAFCFITLICPLKHLLQCIRNNHIGFYS